MLCYNKYIVNLKSYVIFKRKQRFKFSSFSNERIFNSAPHFILNKRLVFFQSDGLIPSIESPLNVESIVSVELQPWWNIFNKNWLYFSFELSFFCRSSYRRCQFWVMLEVNVGRIKAVVSTALFWFRTTAASYFIEDIGLRTKLFTCFQ